MMFSKQFLIGPQTPMTAIKQMLLVLQQAAFQTMLALVASMALLFFINNGTSNNNWKCVGKLPSTMEQQNTGCLPTSMKIAQMSPLFLTSEEVIMLHTTTYSIGIEGSTIL